MPDGSVLEADICIIGAGAAGITIARELASTRLRVCLVESGGLTFEPATQDLYKGETVGHPYVDIDVPRLRFFGGSTNHWTGRCAPLPPTDFERRPWVPYSGWPITRADLDPFYRRAQPICGLGKYVYDEDDLWQRLGMEPVGFDQGLIETQVLQVSPPTRFGEAYRAEIGNAPNIQTLLHANVTNIQSSENGAEILHVDLASLDGKRGRVRAGTFVLACGGLENPRLLLSSDSVEPAGLGNRHDLVGRFFMDHGITQCALIQAADPFALLDRFRSIFKHDDGVFQTGLTLGHALARREQTLNGLAMMYYVPDPSSGVSAARQLWNGLGHGMLPSDLADKIWRVITDLDVVALNARRVLWQNRSVIESPQVVFLETENEQTPNPESRVTLSDERDVLGMRRIALDWRLTELDRRTVDVFARTIGREFGRLNLGRLQISPDFRQTGDGWQQSFRANVHHIGTTRMADDPRQGVVDRDCRVHGVRNLYVMGSSVFPTTGTVNPTLTIVALALRLADQLRAG